MKAISFIITLLIISTQITAEEMIIGTEKNVYPGIDLIFEGAPKDTVYPAQHYLEESDTDIHIEMLANWSKDNKFGAPEGGFVAYLQVDATITNQKTQATLKTQLTPHINIIDNFHYAQNIKLPGKTDDLYTVTFTIKPPKNTDLGIHHDWHHRVKKVIEKSVYTYENQLFHKVSKKLRRW
jgi:uncharacterized protein involved in high-affinity Fe2+ transport